MSDTPLPPPPPGRDQLPTATPAAPPTAQSPQLPPPPPGAPEPPTAGPATEPPTVVGPTAGSSSHWKPVAAIAGSALGGALVAFLISWAVIGHDGSSHRPISSSQGRAAQGQSPSAGGGNSSGSGSGSGGGSGSASGSTGRGQRQGSSGSGTASGSTGQRQGGMPSARSGAS